LLIKIFNSKKYCFVFLGGKMKNKKFLKAIAAITLSASAALGAFGLAACGHTHNYQWENSDPNQHWKVCADDGEEEEGSRANHDFTNGDCICGRPKPSSGGEEDPNPNPNPNPGPGETTYTVTFNTGDGGSQIASATTGTDGMVAKPLQDPTNTDLTKRFTGWYSDSACTTPFDFNKALTEDTTIYAGWRVVNEYDTFLETQGEKVIYNNEFTNVETLETWDQTWGEKGIYTYTNNETSAEGNYVAVGGGKAELIDTTGKATNLIVDFGFVTGVVEGYAEITVKDGGDSWTPLQFVGTSSAKKNSEVLGLRMDGGKIKYRLDGGAATATTLNPGLSDKTYKIDFKFDLESGKVTIKIDGEVFLDELETTISEIKGLKFVSSDNGSKTLSVNYLAVANTPMELETYRILTLEKFKTAYEAYDQTKYTTAYTEGEYESNGKELEAKYNAAKTAIEGASNVNSVYEEYNNGITALKAVPNDDALRLIAAKEAACTDIDSYRSEEAFTLNAEAKTAAQEAAKVAINACKTEEAVTSTLAEEKAKIDEIKNDAQELEAKKVAAKEELNNYKDSSNYTYPQNKQDYDDKIAAGEAAIDVVEIGAEGAQAALTAVDEALANAKAALDGVKTNDQMASEVTLGQKKEAQKTALETYAENVKNDNEGDTRVAAVVDDALASGLQSIQDVAGVDTSLDETAKAAVDTAYDNAKAAIDNAVATLKATEYEITANGVDGVAIPGVNIDPVKYGGTIVKPAAPKQDGKLFDGWYTAAEGGEAFDFTTKIYENTTIYARFVDIPTYETLSVKDNVIIKDDFSAYAEGQKLVQLGENTSIGIYSVEADAAVIVDGGSGNLALRHNPSGANVNMRVLLGTVSGVVEGAYEFSVDAMGSSWQLLQFGSLSGTTNTVLAALNTEKDGTLNFVGATVTPDNGAKVEVNKKYTVYFKIDLQNKTLTIAINNKSFVSNLSIDLTGVNNINFVSSSSGKRKTTLDNIVVTGSVESVDAYKVALSAQLTELASGLTHDGITAALSGIDSATTTTTAYEAYYGGLAAVKEAAAAKAFADAKQAALDEIEATYPADNYKQSKTDYDEAVALINNATTVADVATQLEAAKAAISILLTDEQLNSAKTLTIIVSDTQHATVNGTVSVSGTTSAAAVKAQIDVADTHMIEGYYTDNTYTTKFDFTAEITENKDIYVKIDVKPAYNENESYVASNMTSGDKYAVDAPITENTLFTATAKTALEVATPGKTLTNADNANVGSLTLKSADFVKKTSHDILTITAKEKVTVTIYLTSLKANCDGTRAATATMNVGSNQLATVTIGEAKGTLYVITATIEAGQTATLNVEGTVSNSFTVYVGGIEATIAA